MMSIIKCIDTWDNTNREERQIKLYKLSNPIINQEKVDWKLLALMLLVTVHEIINWGKTRNEIIFFTVILKLISDGSWLKFSYVIIILKSINIFLVIDSKPFQKYSIIWLRIIVTKLKNMEGDEFNLTLFKARIFAFCFST